ncbi:hypothetical protein SAMN05421762_1354 [Pseudooceanicola nitratireducens]|jgi:hypothetical protein|uniref:Uncharacterized protein n=1 Tax=Pseudooceanicola nitratireducens TaxID=517719 RepID=A0A1I1K696_9RHOB|nr:hypothetical protein [Pseudooceanicola nitratireducens]SEJ48377.1 hypothetical protein SAMN05216183_103438 [Pseudooceanicola nitratireducens]SFC56364.1 hypothetical protein SAMN05421762_1354 [Pseudooceanicola nitratireducens]
MTDHIEAQHHATMNALAEGIDKILNSETMPARRFGFVLLVSEFGKIEDGRVNYISNGNRDSMIAMLREYLARLEGRYTEAETGIPQ